MQKECNYVCRQATIEDIKARWDYEINQHTDKIHYLIAKNEYVNEAIKGTRITYIGILNNKIICDATVIIKEAGIQSEAQQKDNLVNDKRCFLCGIRTNKEYENQGYFSKLYKYMERDLKKRGYKEISLSVDVKETRNVSIYTNWGYKNYIRTEIKHSKEKDYIFDYYYKII